MIKASLPDRTAVYKSSVHFLPWQNWALASSIQCSADRESNSLLPEACAISHSFSECMQNTTILIIFTLLYIQDSD